MDRCWIWLSIAGTLVTGNGGGQPSEAEAESRAGGTDEQIARWIKIQIGG